jgi:RNA polymerase sigma-70 factor (ECF subfamily)
VLRVERQGSFRELYDQYGQGVVRLCRLLLRDPEEARDVSQEVLMKLFRARQSGPDVRWDRWLRTVTINACRDRRRSAWWRFWRPGSSEQLDETRLAGRGPTPEQAAFAVETRRWLWSAFRQLPPRQQEVFALRHVEGLSTAEVAEVLGMAQGTAKRHLFRAVRKMRTALGEVR